MLVCTWCAKNCKTLGGLERHWAANPICSKNRRVAHKATRRVANWDRIEEKAAGTRPKLRVLR